MFSPIKLRKPFHGRNPSLIEEIGGWFIGANLDENTSFPDKLIALTPLHGRVAGYLHDTEGWVLIKGVGWTFGGPRVLVSPKDSELCFGLYDKAAAMRELGVSDWLAANGLNAARVQGFAEIDDSRFDSTVFQNGHPVTPVLLYTSVTYPLRVADLAYFDDVRKDQIIAEVSSLNGWAKADYVEEFIYTLSRNVAEFQSAGGCNDTLDPNNVTLAGEITDFEWVGVPDVPLPWGDFDENLVQRRQKEVIYLYDIFIKLAAMLGSRIDHDRILGIMCDAFGSKVKGAQQILDALHEDVITDVSRVSIVGPS